MREEIPGKTVKSVKKGALYFVFDGPVNFETDALLEMVVEDGEIKVFIDGYKETTHPKPF